MGATAWELKKLCKSWAGRDQTETEIGTGMGMDRHGSQAAAAVGVPDKAGNNLKKPLSGSDGVTLASARRRAADDGTSSSSSSAAATAGGSVSGVGNGRDALRSGAGTSSAKGGGGQKPGPAVAAAAAAAVEKGKGMAHATSSSSAAPWARSGGGAGGGAEGGTSHRDKAVDQLEELLCEECPFCGEMLLRQVDAPFVGANERGEAGSWKI